MGEMVETLVKESEDIITRLQQGVSEINEKHRSYAGEALKDMIFIKLQLKTSRISLNDLAQRTLFAVADLKAFPEAFFADDREAISETSNVVDMRNAEKIDYVKEQMAVMVNLINDTNTKINEVGFQRRWRRSWCSTSWWWSTSSRTRPQTAPTIRCTRDLECTQAQASQQQRAS